MSIHFVLDTTSNPLFKQYLTNHSPSSIFVMTVPPPSFLVTILSFQSNEKLERELQTSDHLIFNMAADTWPPVSQNIVAPLVKQHSLLDIDEGTTFTLKTKLVLIQQYVVFQCVTMLLAGFILDFAICLEDTTVNH